MKHGCSLTLAAQPTSALAKRVDPHPVVIHQNLGLRPLLWRQFRRKAGQTVGRIHIPAYCRQGIPQIGSDQIGGGAAPDLIIPAQPGLRPCMPFHRRPQVPLERPDIVAGHAKAKGVHDANQFFGFGVAGTCVNLQLAAGLFKLLGLHQIAGAFHIGLRHARQKHKRGARATYAQCTQITALLLALLAGPVAAQITDQDYIPADAAQARIGQLLFYDKVLSGNRNISCGTCHHHDLAGGDGLSLGIGEGGTGLGRARQPGTADDAIRKRIPRNAPSLWNLGHKDIRVLFHDGRLTQGDQYANGFNSPAEEWLPSGLDNLVAAQALFPLTAQFEMAGNPRENEIAGAIHDRPDTAWPIIAKRVRVIPEYGDMFVQAFDHIEDPADVTIVDIGNALGAFITTEWRSFDSPYDAWLQGAPLPDAAERGRKIFFESARCATCHAGPLFTDQNFYALALPAFGPGRTRPWDPMPRDVGRMGKTNLIEDAYRFRTPSLRNVALTAPYGHNGAYPTLDGMIRHHMNPLAARAAWTPALANLPDVPWLQAADFAIQADTAEMARQTARIDIQPFSLTDTEIADLVAFLQALTGDTAQTRPLGRPDQVPSGLPVD